MFTSDIVCSYYNHTSISISCPRHRPGIESMTPGFCNPSPRKATHTNNHKDCNKLKQKRAQYVKGCLSQWNNYFISFEELFEKQGVGACNEHKTFTIKRECGGWTDLKKMQEPWRNILFGCTYVGSHKISNQTIRKINKEVRSKKSKDYCKADTT